MWRDPRDQLGLPPPAIGFKPEYLPGPAPGSGEGFKNIPPSSLGGGGGGGGGGGLSAPPHYYPYGGENQIYPTPNKYETKASVLPYGTPESTPRYQKHYNTATPTSNTKGSKSLPNSPVKRPTASWTQRDNLDPNTGKYANNFPQSMKRAQSIPEADPNLLENSKKSAQDKKTKYHKGHVYQCVPDDPGRVEKETVL